MGKLSLSSWLVRTTTQAQNQMHTNVVFIRPSIVLSLLSVSCLRFHLTRGYHVGFEYCFDRMHGNHHANLSSVQMVTLHHQ
jgi:hypothetical protein